MKQPVRDRRRVAIETQGIEWATRAAALIASKVADARAHALTGINRSLVDAPDGRATFLRIARNRSLQAATVRLNELLTLLAGPSVRSLDGFISDAWEAIYRDCRAYWEKTLEPEILHDRPPSTEQIRAARGLIINGYDARTAMARVINPASRMLRPLLVAQASKTRPEGDRRGSLKAWEVSTVKSIVLATRNAIFTGAFMLDRLASRDVINPELLHPDPSLSGA
jgi:hypothetical protein